MNKQDSFKLENRSIDEIKKISQEKKFAITSPLYYEGQIPIVAYLLLEGCIQLLKNKKIKKILKPGSLIGLNELMNNTPAKLSAQVQADSTVCYLDRSTIKELINDKESDLATLLKEDA